MKMKKNFNNTSELAPQPAPNVNKKSSDLSVNTGTASAREVLVTPSLGMSLESIQEQANQSALKYNNTVTMNQGSRCSKSKLS